MYGIASTASACHVFLYLVVDCVFSVSFLGCEQFDDKEPSVYFFSYRSCSVKSFLLKNGIEI